MSTPTEDNFLKWLKAQSDRNDPIGDLATDYCASGLDPMTFALSDMMSEDASKALHAALREYSNIMEYELMSEDPGEE